MSLPRLSRAVEVMQPDSPCHSVPYRSRPRVGYSYVDVKISYDHYRWWALSCTSVGMLLAATNSGTLIIALPDLERALAPALLGLVWVILAYMIASTVLVLTAGRLSDLFGRKQAYVGGFVVFSLASLGAGLRRRRHAADPVADPAGHRRRVPVRQRRRARHGRVPARAARPGHGHEHDGRRDRPRPRPGARRRAGRDLVAVGVLVQRAARPGRRGLGRARPARAGDAATPARARPAGHRHLRRRASPARARRLEGRALGLGRPGRDRRADRRRRAAAGVRADRAPRPRADARPRRSSATACSRPRPPRRSSTASRASR